MKCLKLPNGNLGCGRSGFTPKELGAHQNKPCPPRSIASLRADKEQLKAIEDAKAAEAQAAAKVEATSDPLE